MSANRMARAGLLAAILVSCIGCDQVTKSIAAQTLGRPPHETHSFLGDTIRLQYALNPGAFLGLGKHLTPAQRFSILTVTNGLAMLGLGYVLVRKWSMARIKFVAGALILSGGIGNLIDRVRQQGLVTDFLNVGIGPLVRTGIFNVADMAIMAGCIIFFALWWREERQAGAPAAPSPE
ncbi:MAG: signal peptidase II [Planctomycetia bacterium]|nr:signal peptidase II [Planctomycetia bacterium]